MRVSVPEMDRMSEPEREFERWLLAALEHGRVQLGISFNVTPLGAPKPPIRCDEGLSVVEHE